MSKVLITGGNGFLGQNIIPELEKAGFEVTSLVFDAFKDDISQLLQNADFDFVLHLAAYASPKLATNFDKTIKLNVNLTEQLLQISSQFKSLKKFLFFSSATTYSDEAARPLKENSAQKAAEDDYYAYSKIEAEKICKKFIEQGQPVKILRLTNCFGPHQNWKDRPNLIPQIMKEAILEKKITVLNGSHTRDFLYSRDLARIILLCLEDKQDFDILNIASGQLHKVSEIADFVSKALYVPVEDKKQEINRAKDLTLDTSKFIKLFPTFKFTSLENSLKETLDFYLSEIKP